MRKRTDNYLRSGYRNVRAGQGFRTRSRQRIRESSGLPPLGRELPLLQLDGLGPSRAGTGKLFGVLLGCGLRRKEAAELEVAHLQRPEDH